MAFFGCQFVFDGISSYEYGLTVYDFGSQTEGGQFSSGATILEDRTPQRYTPIFYGVTQNTPLTFTLTFGADSETIDAGKWLDRWELDTISRWLTGHRQYKYLEVVQPDMEAVRYRCLITDLQYTTYGKMPWALTCTVTCDSPFAYLYPETTKYTVGGTMRKILRNRASSFYYYPKLELNVNGGSFSIKNLSDNGRMFAFSDLPRNNVNLIIDNENEIITTDKDGLNPYDKFNFRFLRLIPGNNELEFSVSSGGSANVTITCEYPVNIGG